MDKKLKSTWLEYLQNCSYNTSLSEKAREDVLKQILDLSKGFTSLFYSSIPMVYLLDYTTGKYLTMSQSADHVLGYSNKMFMENGVGFTIDKYQKEHLTLFDKKLFPDRLNVLKKIPPEEHSNYLFTYNLRIKDSKGSYANLLQRNIFIKSDDHGNPLISAGLVINIDHYHKDNPVLQVVEKIPSTKEVSFPEVIFKKAYYLKEEDQQFSTREKEVLLWLSEGLTSKEIATRLFLSEDTVVVHRKNMLLKTGLPNVAALVTHALRNGII